MCAVYLHVNEYVQFFFSLTDDKYMQMKFLQEYNVHKDTEQH